MSDGVLLKAIRITTTATTLISSVGFAVNTLQGNYLIAGMEMFRGLSVLMLWIYASRTKNLVAGIIGQIFVTWVAFTILMILGGGLGSLYLFWLIILPSLALMLGSIRLGMSLAIATTLSIIAIIMFSATGEFHSYAQPEGNRRGFSALLCMSVMMLISHMTLGWRDSLAATLEDENAKRQSEHAKKNQFFIHMNHEIRNPLNALMASAEMLALDEANLKQGGVTAQSAAEIDRRRSSLIASIKTTSEHVLSIVNDVLEIEKLGNTNEPHNLQPFSIRGLGEDVLEIFSAKAAVMGTEIAVRYKMGLEDTWIGSVARIRQVLLNLTSNALQHSGGTKILITVSSSDKGLEFEVRDNGKGIEEAALGQIFNPFSSSVVGGGFSGLGLGICKILVEDKMGGTIGAASKRGEGTTFSLTIPIKSVNSDDSFEYIHEGGSDRKKSDKHAELDFNAVNLLLIEDNEENGKLMQMLLQSRGFHVEVAKTSQEALQVANSYSNISVVLVDHNLGEDSQETGIDLTRNLVAKGLPNVIGFTGNYSSAIHDTWIAAGAKAIIQKPAAVATIVREIATVLGHEKANSNA